MRSKVGDYQNVVTAICEISRQAVAQMMVVVTHVRFFVLLASGDPTGVYTLYR